MSHLIDRVSLGQEPGWAFTPEDRARLPFVRSGPIWQAGIQVFLHPWPFLHAELRDDVTDTGRSHARALTQGEPDSDTARLAYLAYLEELNELDQMQVLALHEHKTGSSSTLYVIGRSPDKPYRHYLRTCTWFGQPDEMQWTGWERLDFDVPGEHVIPFVFEGDLHVAWPVIRRINVTGVREEEQPLEVSLAWHPAYGPGLDQATGEQGPAAGGAEADRGPERGRRDGLSGHPGSRP